MKVTEDTINGGNAASRRRSVSLLVAAVLLFAADIGLDQWLTTHERDGTAEVVLLILSITVMIVLPIAIFTLAGSALLLLTVGPICRSRHPLVVGGLIYTGLAAAAGIVGKQVSGIYGLDPPYYLFWLGGGLQLLSPLLVVAGVVAIVLKRRSSHAKAIEGAA